MRLWLKRIAKAALVLLIALLLAPTVVPPFLDRVYYRGPKSDHFDGRHFFNPDPDRHVGPPLKMHAFLWRMLGGRTADPWPTQVAVTPGYPPSAATPCPPRREIENWARCTRNPDPDRMFATWIGHSTVLIQTQGIAILTDPVWSDHAGPFGFGPKRVRAPGIRFDDLPRIDLVLISHDHYDHMDLATLARLWKRDRPLIVTSLGNDAILRNAGIEAQARDWGGRVTVRPGRRLADGSYQPPIDVIVERVHHWGTRWGSDRNRALWSGFTVTLPRGNLFFAGDTGWGDGSWQRDAAKDGPYRLAILPIGAFLPPWVMSPSHIGPEDAVATFQQLGAASALAVHWGTFHLSEEGIDTPPRLLAASLAKAHIAPGRFRAIEVGRPWEIPLRRH